MSAMEQLTALFGIPKVVTECGRNVHRWVVPEARRDLLADEVKAIVAELRGAIIDVDSSREPYWMVYIDVPENDDTATISDAEFAAAVASMLEAGKRAGTASGSWIADGNTSEEHLRAVLRQWEDGDPAGPSAPAPFSGEWAGDPSVEDVIGSETDLDVESLTPEEISELADAFEEGFYSAWQEEAERTVRGLLPD